MKPSCLHPETLIDTPDGGVCIAALLPGVSSVWSQDTLGNRIVARVDVAAMMHVKPAHSMLRLSVGEGVFFVSGQHPMPDGTPIEHTYPTAPRVTASQTGTDVTHDIAVTGPTGIYFAHGIALGSTLDERFRRSSR